DGGRAGAAHGEREVVAGAVPHVAVQDVEVGGIAGPQHPVAVDVRVGIGALAGDRIDPLDVLRAQVVQHLADEADALVLAHAGAHLAIYPLAGSVDATT